MYYQAYKPSARLCSPHALIYYTYVFRLLSVESKTDCQKKRKEAMQQITDDFMTGVFVPQCTSTGEYKKVQCEASTGYCWCVDENGEQVGYETRNENSLNCESKRSPGSYINTAEFIFLTITSIIL